VTLVDNGVGEQMDESVKVSIGLPVYNGQNYLAQAIESVLAQTYSNFELIICDNASEDDTPQICKKYEKLDSRVRYVRNQANIGAAANHNKTYELATGGYFKWISHDDLLAPRYLEACVAALNKDPGAILAQSVVHCIDGEGKVFFVYDHSSVGTGSARQSDRFGGAARNHRCLEIFSVIRTEALAGSVMHAGYAGADQTLIIELALRGRFALVPEPLFLNREHSNRSSKWKDRMELFTWWTGQRGRWICSTWLFVLTCLRLINRHAASPADRIRCYGHLIASLRMKGRLRLLVLEPFAAIDPRFYTGGAKMKKTIARLFWRSGSGRNGGMGKDLNASSS
jgi:glycosyltransferase involved in cell wall biosynthesis